MSAGTARLGSWLKPRRSSVNFVSPAGKFRWVNPPVSTLSLAKFVSPSSGGRLVTGFPLRTRKLKLVRFVSPSGKE